MNKYNIEVGDKVRTGDNSTVKVVYPEGICFTGLTSMRKSIFRWEYVNKQVESGYWDLVKSKMNKGKIIGYTLLKDTPGANRGTVADKEGFATNKFNDRIKWDNNTLSQAEWFSPIYEVVKPTEVYVDTLAGKVRVTKDKLVLESSGESIPTNMFSAIKYSIDSYTPVVLSSFGATKLTTFNVGCKTFNVSGLSKLEEAIKQVS